MREKPIEHLANKGVFVAVVLHSVWAFDVEFQQQRTKSFEQTALLLNAQKQMIRVTVCMPSIRNLTTRAQWPWVVTIGQKILLGWPPPEEKTEQYHFACFEMKINE